MLPRVVPAVASTKIEGERPLVAFWREGLAVAANDGEAVILDRRLAPAETVAFGDGLAVLAPAPDGSRWAWVSENRLHVGDPGALHGGIEAVPDPASSSCAWSPSGELLWFARGTGDAVVLDARDRDGRVLARAVLPDPFGASMPELCPHPFEDTVVLWIAAGQDGQRTQLCTVDGGSLRTVTLPIDHHGPALFAADGTWFVSSDDHDIVRLSWPGGDELGRLAWAAIDREPGDDEDGPGYDVQLLPGGFASWSSVNGRIHIVDLATMAAVDEIVLEGHPRVTAEEMYPTLHGDLGLCTDFGYARAVGDGLLLSVHDGTLVLSRASDWSPEPERPFPG